MKLNTSHVDHKGVLIIKPFTRVSGRTVHVELPYREHRKAIAQRRTASLHSALPPHLPFDPHLGGGSN